MTTTTVLPLEITPETFTKELRTKLDKKLSRTKGQLFIMPGSAYLGSLLCSHKFVWSFYNETAWCDGSTIGWNPNFFLKLSPAARVMVLAHELWHTGYGHMIRLGNRCPDIWNIAADHVINLMLESQGFCFDLPITPCKDPRFIGMTTEQVYDILIQDGMKPFEIPEWLKEQIETGMGGDVIIPEPGKEDATKETVKTIMVQAQQAAIRAQQAGSLPGEISIKIDEFLKPKINWRVKLARFFTALSKDDYSWKCPSRRYSEYLPSLIGDNGLEHLIYYLDCSGSISDQQLIRFNSEVKSIHKNLRPEKLTLVTFDTRIQNVYDFTPDDPFNEIEVTGRGGTCLRCVKDHIMEHKPTAAVVFSDMYVPPMDEDPKVPLIWVVMENPSATVPFGTMIHFDTEDL